jgi:hypothetical protein
MKPECRICLGDCDPDIHEATVSVREWFRGQVLMDRSVVPPKKPNPGILEVRKLRQPIGDFPKATPGPGWKDFR